MKDKKDRQKEYTKKYYQKNRKKLLKQNRDYHRSNHVKIIETKRKYNQTPRGRYLELRRHRKERVKISLDKFVEWFESQLLECYYCEIKESEMGLITDSLNNRSLKLTIDRKDNSKLYEEGNLLLACRRCNFVKSNFFSVEEMREIGKKYIKPKWMKKQ